MRPINETIEMEPKRRFTFEELAAITYGSPVTRSRLVAVRRAVQALVSAKRVSLGKCQDSSNPLRARWLAQCAPSIPNRSAKRCLNASGIKGTAIMSKSGELPVSATTALKKAVGNTADETLISLVEQLVATKPFKAGGFDWAAQPQSDYCEKLDVSAATLRRRIAKPPFVRAWKMVGAQTVTVGEDTTVLGGKNSASCA